MKEIQPTTRIEEEPTGRHGLQEGLFPTVRWAFFHYGWLIMFLGVAVGLLAAYTPIAGLGQTSYESAAVVTARELTIRTEELPQTAAAIFNAGPVANAAVEATGAPYDPVVLIPDHVRLEPVEATIVLRVVATDPDPELSAALANAAADALVDELQRLGAGIGRFAIHTQAAVPQVPESSGPLDPVLIGILAGLVFGVGMVGVLVTIRRPILSSSAATEVSQLPVLATLSLSSADAHGDLRFLPGLDRLMFRLFPQRDERRHLVGVNVRPRDLRLLGIVLVRRLANQGKAALVGPGASDPPFGTEDEASLLIADDFRAPSPESGIPTVVLGRFLPEQDEHGYVKGRDDQLVLVIGEGAPTRAVLERLDELEGAVLHGVVLLKSLGWRDIQRRRDPLRA